MEQAASLRDTPLRQIELQTSNEIMIKNEEEETRWKWARFLEAGVCARNRAIKEVKVLLVEEAWHIRVYV